MSSEKTTTTIFNIKTWLKNDLNQWRLIGFGMILFAMVMGDINFYHTGYSAALRDVHSMIKGEKPWPQ